MIRNLVFDYGGVIVNLHDSTVRQAFMDLRVSLWKQVIHRKRIKRLMAEFIDGVRPTNEVVAEIHALCGSRVTLSQLHQVLSLLADELPPSRLARIVALRQRYKVYVLSNINDILWQTCVRQINSAGRSVDECFDGVFLSYEMGVAKPDEAIYRQMLAETGMNPAETLYFDDRRDNVEAGQRLGFVASQVVTNQLEQNPLFAAL